MGNDDELLIPPVGREEHVWHIADDAPVSRSRRSRGNGDYESTVPARLASLELSISAALSADVEEAAGALSRFDMYAASRLGAGNRVLGPMSAVLLRTEATSSSQIEHLTVGAKNLALETIHESSSDNAAIVVGNVRAMEAALRLSKDMDEEHVLAMHRALMLAQPGWEEEAGRYRDRLVWVGTDSYSPRGASHVAQQAELVPAAMRDLLAFIARDDLPVIVQCAMAHAQFETIHPFSDGNGRCGRALVHAILRNKSLVHATTPPVSAGLLRRTDSYFDALTAFRNGDAEPIVESFVEACLFAASSGERLIDDLTHQLDLAREQLQGTRSDSPVWRVLPQLIEQPIVTTKYLCEALGLSKSQSERAIRRMESAGVLTARSGRQRNVIWEHRGILDVLDAYAVGLRRR
ncbi:Fic family protein [Bifidobacterium callitrichos]|uniref:Filamentation induced by cAMP protein fic n=1 Tax=Bifidobacterium callitrichos DSM 23973 TaxID=1437609 RepID=A0A087ABD1_9BIFI|nr:Fic family protein [Bifidobacterium callitrichos]KFI56081.1 filamentation induced by cAMP protein fic [Bifidobacterium callitrichos DSM 23973]